MAAKAREHLRGVQPCPHGSISQREMAERGLATSDVIDFSASCNPLGASPAALAAIQRVDVARYPDDEATELRKALARTVGLQLEWIAVGNGSVELMWLLAAAYLESGDKVLVIGPTFGEYARACRVAGARVEELSATEEAGFRVDVPGVAKRLRALRPKLAFVCNPNNPTGQLLSNDEMKQLLDACEETLLVVDEAYISFCQSPPDLLPYIPSGRLLLLRSMTKDYGLAGLRLGYAIACPEVVEWLQRVRPPWSVNAFAQAAGLAALGDAEHVEKARRVVEQARGFLLEMLPRLGLQVVPSATNFILVKVGDAASFRAALLSHGICVRDCASFGLPAYIRIGVRTMSECQRLVEAAREVIAGGC